MARVARFWSHVDQSGGSDACWPWTASKDADGYGFFYPSTDRCIKASRFALQLKLGRELGENEVTRHGDTCSTRACCNPDHLSPGSHADNSADRVRMGRSPLGERNPKAILTADQVTEIRRTIRAGRKRATFSFLAKAYGVSRTCIRHIAAGTNWRHLPDAAAPTPAPPCPYPARLVRDHGVAAPAADRLDQDAHGVAARARAGEFTREQALALPYEQALAVGVEMGIVPAELVA